MSNVCKLKIKAHGQTSLCAPQNMHHLNVKSIGHLTTSVSFFVKHQYDILCFDQRLHENITFTCLTPPFPAQVGGEVRGVRALAYGGTM